LQSINLNNGINKRRQKNRVKPEQPILSMKMAAQKKGQRNTGGAGMNNNLKPLNAKAILRKAAPLSQ
jgi:hypothetical protein